MRQRDREAADGLIRKYYDEIFFYVLRQIRRRETALDLTQDIFVALLKSIERYDEEKASIRTYLYRIATNRVIDYVRSAAYRHGQKAVAFESMQIADELDFALALENRQTAKRILDVAGELPAPMQTAFRMKLLANLSFRDIAQTLQLPESTVKTRYYAAIAKVRDVMKEEETYADGRRTGDSDRPHP